MAHPNAERAATALAERDPQKSSSGGRNTEAATRSQYNFQDRRTLRATLTPKKLNHGSDRENFYLYDVSVDGETIVVDGRDPEHEAARALLPRGIVGKLEIFEATGKHRTTVNIEAAAELTVSEGRRGLALRKWQPLTEIANLRARPSRRTAESGEVGRWTYRNRINPPAVPPRKPPAPREPRKHLERPMVQTFVLGPRYLDTAGPPKPSRDGKA